VSVLNSKNVLNVLGIIENYLNVNALLDTLRILVGNVLLVMKNVDNVKVVRITVLNVYLEKIEIWSCLDVVVKNSFSL